MDFVFGASQVGHCEPLKSKLRFIFFLGLWMVVNFSKNWRNWIHPYLRASIKVLAFTVPCLFLTCDMEDKFWSCWRWLLLIDSWQASALGTLCSRTAEDVPVPSLHRLNSEDAGSRAGAELTAVGAEWPRRYSVPAFLLSLPTVLRKGRLGGRRGSQTRGAGMLLTHLGARSFAKSKAASPRHPYPAVAGPWRTYTATQFGFGCNVHAHMQIAASPRPRPPR